MVSPFTGAFNREGRPDRILTGYGLVRLVGVGKELIRLGPDGIPSGVCGEVTFPKIIKRHRGNLYANGVEVWNGDLDLKIDPGFF